MLFPWVSRSHCERSTNTDTESGIRGLVTTAYKCAAGHWKYGEYPIIVPTEREARQFLEDMMRKFRWVTWLIVLPAFVVGFGFSLLAGVGSADNRDTGYLVYWNGDAGTLGTWCVKGRALLRHPSIDSGFILDYNSYSQSWDLSCSNLKSAPANYHNVAAQLRGPNGDNICRSFGWVSNSSATNTFGAGAAAGPYCGAGTYKVRADQYFISGARTGNQTSATHSF